ncbi:MAG: 50S ribosomal protein L1 [DPANN group archaeon]|nr:50S ribosomal protein L1 [DPANN group archaeon]
MSEINKIIENLKKNKKERNFIQSVDLAINLKGMDFKKVENRFREDVLLPKGRSKPAKICVIGTELISKAKGIADITIDEKSLDKYKKDKTAIKKLVREIDFFIAEPQLMANIGKSFGKYMSPMGKMPRPMPPQADPAAMINKLKNTIVVNVTDKAPVIHCQIGSESMDNKDLEENAKAVINVVKNKLPSQEHNIKSIYLKLTMSNAAKIDVSKY